MNRNILLFRSAAAILCLATVPLDMTPSSGLNRLVAERRSLLLSSILALESLWLVHVIHDMLLPLAATWRQFPMACIVWLVIVLLDQCAPLDLSVTLHRQCYAVNMDYMTYCSSGTVRVGHWDRCMLLLSILGSVVAASLVSRHRVSANMAPKRPSAIFPPRAPSTLTASPTTRPMVVIDAIMCGIVPLRWHGTQYLFDLKVWLWLRVDELETTDKPSPILPFSAPTLPTQTTQPNWDWPSLLGMRSVQRLLGLLGIVYTGITLWSNTTYLNVLETALANDYGWAGFNATGMHAFLANTFNRQLLTSTDASIALHGPAFGDPLQSYNSSATSVAWYPTVARRYLFNASAPLHELVAGLRAMHPCQMPWMFTQYCWLDLDRTWEMASTSQRQARCAALSQHNGARYLETSLRNLQDWTVWRSCWGTSFDIGIGNDLAASVPGRLWLQHP
ncbi:hypothetical protein SDRG_15459 [Saprolegnia diclina VS20]|uniref:Uncharacterized protein n=1 Tax=Saprolegnia diclina (strain VS20) TaxID=1156394 RepID=T0Q041_SAPDV|nr:hypothetical protein SDRG_15459 [Saprolegnia diclina VS20]EQC26730.1 hypothetical protein SDRG_15459 [Saprolegnia diclina VS20]|eukprot:XP_008619854.1 hypothetical protein SDRG_15459 [Saprolegnia diclina VS20]